MSHYLKCDKSSRGLVCEPIRPPKDKQKPSNPSKRPGDPSCYPNKDGTKICRPIPSDDKPKSPKKDDPLKKPNDCYSPCPPPGGGAVPAICLAQKPICPKLPVCDSSHWTDGLINHERCEKPKKDPVDPGYYINSKVKD